MLTPPPVSGQNYSTAFASETNTNTLRAGLTFTTAYSSNVESTTPPISDVSYSIWPTIALDATRTRLHLILSYSPGFTFYQRVTELNQGNQNLVVDFQYRLSPHVTLDLRDSFLKTSNPFDQPNPLMAMSVSGAAASPNVAVIAPGASYLLNNANAELTYQIGAESKVGVSGAFTNLSYPNPAETPGLYNSSSATGSMFYSRRLHDKYYVGASYQYMNVSAYQAEGHSNTQTQTQTIFGFCTVYLKPTLSVSISGGPQHSDTTQAPLPASRSWSPMLTASLGWQGQRTSLAASFSKIVTGGGGLTGAYHSYSANLSGRWQVSRNWSFGLSASYWLYQTLTPFFFGSNSGGHTVSGTASVQHPLGEHLTIDAGYTRLQQSYTGVAAISAIPETNREFVTVSYRFTRPLQR